MIATESFNEAVQWNGRSDATCLLFLKRRTADLALAACLKILTRIETVSALPTQFLFSISSQSPALRHYASDIRLQRRFGTDFRVQVGLGLHFGIAIEGAIGSDLKVDASYLGADVNLASRLESATKQLGVPLLMSQQFVNLLSPQLQVCFIVIRTSSSFIEICVG